MRLALAFLVACSGSPKPQPTPSPTPSPVEVAADGAGFEPPKPSPSPVAMKPLSKDLESTPKPAKSARITQAEVAWQANEDGKRLVAATEYGDAANKFRDAVARVPEAAYFYNLCFALYNEGRFGEALTACNAVGNSSPTPAQLDKAANLSAHVRDEAQKQGIDVEVK